MFAPGLRQITPLLWVCFAATLMTHYFLNSWLPLLGAASGLSREQISLTAMLYSVGGTLGGILMSVLMDRYGFVVIALLFALAVPAIALLGLTGMSGPRCCLWSLWRGSPCSARSSATMPPPEVCIRPNSGPRR